MRILIYKKGAEQISMNGEQLKVGNVFRRVGAG